MSAIPVAPLLPSPHPPGINPPSEIGIGTQTAIPLANGVVQIFNDSDLLTTSVYLASLPPQIAALWAVDPQTNGPTPNRVAMAQALLAAGYNGITLPGIDTGIMVNGGDPFLTQVFRASIGLRASAPFGANWAPSIMEMGTGSGLVGPNDPLPAGAIPVSFLAKDYPSFAPVVVAPPSTPAGNPVGQKLLITVGGKVAYGFAPEPGVSLMSFAVGTKGTAPDGTPVAVADLPGLMGMTPVWVAS